MCNGLCVLTYFGTVNFLPVSVYYGVPIALMKDILFRAFTVETVYDRSFLSELYYLSGCHLLCSSVHGQVFDATYFSCDVISRCISDDLLHCVFRTTCM